jgi:2-keto-4-pentenoate hydratase/2-oxohepta-3-ene-1,7-dioic acid hydratase in catechol pathway
MPLWIRFEHAGKTHFGKLQNGMIKVHEGNMFDKPAAAHQTLPLDAVTVLTPAQPTKMVAVWNNFHALVAKLGLSAPLEPLYVLKAPNSYLASGQTIKSSPSYSGNVVFEGELGVVIGKHCKAVSIADAGKYIFGYTCINDATAAELIYKDATFQQWTRAKNFDTFGVFGPVIATGLNPAELTIKSILNGQERQNYSTKDMIRSPYELVSILSQDFSFSPGDVIACGTSVGVGAMKPGDKIEITIDGIGTLSNEFN